MRLNELFNKAPKMKDEGNEKTFSINGKKYNAYFYYGMRSDEYGREFQFSLEGSDEFKNPNVGVTGTGDEIAVMGAIVKYLKSYMDDPESKNFHFSADLQHASRVKLYDRICKRLMQGTKDRWEFESQKGSNFKTYIFYRPDDYDAFDYT